MATIDISGVPHAYELTDSTPFPHTLVFIHGWLNSRGYWRPLISSLRDDFQCLSYDLRGFGNSQPKQMSEIVLRSPDQSNPSSNLESSQKLHSESYLSQEVTLSPSPLESTYAPTYAPANYAQDLALLLEKLELQDVWLIGHSLGGTIALWAAAQMPDRIKGVICINAGGGIYLREAFEQFRNAGQRFLQVRPKWLSQLPLIDLLFSRASVARPLERQWAKQRVIDFVVADPEAALGALMDSTTEEEVNRLPKLVSQLKQPVYFIAGAEDKVMEPKYVRHLASFHPSFQYCGDNVIEIPDCGHLAMLEQPEAVAQEIRRFICQEDGEE